MSSVTSFFGTQCVLELNLFDNRMHTGAVDK